MNNYSISLKSFTFYLFRRHPPPSIPPFESLHPLCFPFFLFLSQQKTKSKSRILFMIAVCFVTKNHAHAIMSHLFSGTPKFAVSFCFQCQRNGERDEKSVQSFGKGKATLDVVRFNQFAEWANQNVVRGLRPDVISYRLDDLTLKYYSIIARIYKLVGNENGSTMHSGRRILFFCAGLRLSDFHLSFRLSQQILKDTENTIWGVAIASSHSALFSSLPRRIHESFFFFFEFFFLLFLGAVVLP